ncbi:hypothetical protein BS50DRAFT_169208 [Corynespora cassiicola Philippines]|uniref:Uncharacterized protein n=1 Tax=Corynespora cassiicola Philippines TaxID=1448308 RepID=A0A2T2P556_CORCC|nr:hypothetical protein BS50DRAFT_169208 [Corynespora cassiicola Philippines]
MSRSHPRCGKGNRRKQDATESPGWPPATAIDAPVDQRRRLRLRLGALSQQTPVSRASPPVLPSPSVDPSGADEARHPCTRASPLRESHRAAQPPVHLPSAVTSTLSILWPSPLIACLLLASPSPPPFSLLTLSIALFTYPFLGPSLRLVSPPPGSLHSAVGEQLPEDRPRHISTTCPLALHSVSTTTVAPSCLRPPVQPAILPNKGAASKPWAPASPSPGHPSSSHPSSPYFPGTFPQRHSFA